jgi:hypothetical protein
VRLARPIGGEGGHPRRSPPHSCKLELILIVADAPASGTTMTIRQQARRRPADDPALLV